MPKVISLCRPSWPTDQVEPRGHEHRGTYLDLSVGDLDPLAPEMAAKAVRVRGHFPNR